MLGTHELLSANLWALALDDAAIAHDLAVLFVFSGASLTGKLAASWVPGTTIDDPEEVEEFGYLVEDANSVVRDLHRVAIWPEGQPEEVTAGLLRHELEHSRQFAKHGAVARDVFIDAIDALRQQAGDVEHAGVLYQHIPMERDANAAASRFARNIFGDDAVDALGDDERALLARRTDSADPDTVVARMADFVNSGGPDLARRFAMDALAGSDWRQYRLPLA